MATSQQSKSKPVRPAKTAGGSPAITLPAYLTVQEIEDLFPKQWVLVDNPKCTRSDEVLAGTLVFHAERKEAITEEVIKLGLKEFAAWYTGPVDPKLRFAL